MKEAKRTKQVSLPQLAKNTAVCTDRLVHHHLMIGRCRGFSSELGMSINVASFSLWSGREITQKPEAVHNTL
jgi:hypothetical protein